MILGARDRAKGYEAAAELRRAGLDAQSLAIDVLDAASIEAVAEAVRTEHGHLDILVNNAGIAPEASTQDPREIVDVDLFRETFETNVLGAVAVVQWFLPLLRAAPT